MGVMSRLRDYFDPAAPSPGRPERREFLPWVTFDGVTYPLGLTQTLAGDREEVDPGFAGVVNYAYRSNGIVFACMLARFMLFSEARFGWQVMKGGVPGELVGWGDMRQPRNRGLDLLAHPEPGKTTGDLLARAMVHVDSAGNAFFVRRPDMIKLLRPDWVSIVIGSTRDPIEGTYADVTAWDLDATVAGYVYYPGGRYSGAEPVLLDRTEVAHFAPTPDPTASYRGMSWLSPILRETMADSAATNLKLKYFENGATPNLVVKLPVVDPAKFREWTEVFDQNHAGARNAFKTMYLGQGHDATVVGSNLEQMDFKAVQGGGETRIAAAAGVPPVIVGFSEGLQGSSLNAGNYSAARRRFADMTIRPLWRNVCGTLESIVPPPGGHRLWYDDGDIPFLAEDVKDAAEVLGLQATAIRTLVDGGYEADDVVEAVTSGDLSRLHGSHTGLVPVQLQKPGSPAPVDDEATDEAEADDSTQEAS